MAHFFNKTTTMSCVLKHFICRFKHLESRKVYIDSTLKL